MKSLPLLTLLITGFLLSTSVNAFESNKRVRRLPPSVQLKVHKALALSYAEGQARANQTLHRGRGGLIRGGCGNLNLSNINSPNATRIDNITVIRGDVININRNIKCR